MSSPEEQALLDLLLAEQRRNSQRQASERTLPDLTPEMLMSGAALREMEAAKSLSTPFRTVLATVSKTLPESSDTFEFSASDGDIDFETELDTSPSIRVASHSHVEAVDLGSIFMARAMAETGATEEALMRASSSSSYDDFSFDSDIDVPRASPNEAVRFQVGRQSPPPMPMNRDSYRGGNDGTVVSSRGPGGRWQTSSRPRPEGTVRIEPSPTRAPSGRTSGLTPEPSRTVYDHLMSDILDD